MLDLITAPAHSTTRRLERRFALGAARTKALAVALYKRHHVGWLVLVSLPIILLFWSRLAGIGAQLVTELFPQIRFAPDLLIVCGVLIWLFVAFGLPIYATLWLEYFVLASIWTHHHEHHECFWCGHSLKGLPPRQGDPTCPECGQASPAAT